MRVTKISVLLAVLVGGGIGSMTACNKGNPPSSGAKRSFDDGNTWEQRVGDYVDKALVMAKQDSGEKNSTDVDEVTDTHRSSGLTVQEAYSAIHRNAFDGQRGKQVSWPVPANGKVEVRLYTPRKVKDENQVILDGFVLVVQSKDGSSFALLSRVRKVNGAILSVPEEAHNMSVDLTAFVRGKKGEITKAADPLEQAKGQIRKAIPIITKGTVVYGRVGGMYEIKKQESNSSMPFLTDWTFDTTEAPATPRGL